MSGMYNAIFGTNKHADLLLKVLHLDLKNKPECVGRNKSMGIPANTPFQGEIAKRMYEQALKEVRENRKGK